MRGVWANKPINLCAKFASSLWSKVLRLLLPNFPINLIYGFYIYTLMYLHNEWLKTVVFSLPWVTIICVLSIRTLTHPLSEMAVQRKRQSLLGDSLTGICAYLSENSRLSSFWNIHIVFDIIIWICVLEVLINKNPDSVRLPLNKLNVFLTKIINEEKTDLSFANKSIAFNFLPTTKKVHDFCVFSVVRSDLFIYLLSIWEEESFLHNRPSTFGCCLVVILTSFLFRLF